jgi:hypothetical protein
MDKCKQFPVETLIQLPQTLAQFVRGGRETAQAEARSKTKSPAKKEPPKQEAAAVETPKTAQPVKTELPKTASLFDAPESAPSTATADTDEEEELLGAVEEDDQIDEDADLDEAA